MSIKFLVIRGVYLGFFGGGGCRFYFYGRGDFSELFTGSGVDLTLRVKSTTQRVSGAWGIRWLGEI